jgi:hypothetical protein
MIRRHFVAAPADVCKPDLSLPEPYEFDLGGEQPLVCEPAPAEDAPLTSEPPLTAQAALTSEPAAVAEPAEY